MVMVTLTSGLGVTLGSRTSTVFTAVSVDVAVVRRVGPVMVGVAGAAAVVRAWRACVMAACTVGSLNAAGNDWS